jgi:membrane fusion protein, multidrug efflux system
MVEETGRNNNTKKRSLLLVVLLIVIASASLYYWQIRGQVSTDDAYVDGRIYMITPRISGYVTEVLASDNQEVKKGDRLLSLDHTDYAVALAEARASLAEAESTLTSLELGVPLELTQTSQRVRGAEAQLESLRKTMERVMKEEEAAAQELRRAKALHDQSVLDHRRMKDLSRTSSVSQSMLDSAETVGRSSEAQMNAAQARLEGVRKQRASMESEQEGLKANIALAATGQDLALIKARQVDAQKARVELAKSRARQAELDLSYTTVVSPADGFVTRKRVEPGLMASKGQPLMAVVPLTWDNLWITANFKETQLTEVRPGQEVTIRVDTYPAATLKGKVDSIMAGTGSVFSLFPPENATGNFVKVVQRIPVKITLVVNEGATPSPLRVGMSVVPTIHTGR